MHSLLCLTIFTQFQAENNLTSLAFLERAARQIPGQAYKVWDDGYDARDIFSLDFLQQKLDYIHNNPCQPRWHLVERPEDYVWSSARFYLLDKPAIIALDDVRESLA